MFEHDEGKPFGLAHNTIPGYYGWGLVGSRKELGPFTLNPDATMSVQGVSLRQDLVAHLSPLTVGDGGSNGAFSWGPGPDDPLVIMAPDATLAFIFLWDRKFWIGQARSIVPNLPTVVADAWRMIGAGDLEPFHFKQDGTIEVPPHTIRQEDTVKNCSLSDGTRFEKAGGPGQEFVIRAARHTHRFVYLEGFWFHKLHHTTPPVPSFLR